MLMMAFKIFFLNFLFCFLSSIQTHTDTHIARNIRQTTTNACTSGITRYSSEFTSQLAFALVFDQFLHTHTQNERRKHFTFEIKHNISTSSVNTLPIYYNRSRRDACRRHNYLSVNVTYWSSSLQEVCNISKLIGK